MGRYLHFPNKVLPKKYFILLILFLGVVYRLYRLRDFFLFDHDQQNSAEAAYDFFLNNKLTLVGQELSQPGIFLGPLHNWIQFIPYGFCSLNPICIPYFYSAFGIISTLLIYVIISRIINHKTALIAAFIYAISFATISLEGSVNSNYFLLLSSLGLFYSLYKYFAGGNKYLIIGSFIAGAATVNFNPVFMFSALAFFATSLLRVNRKIILYIFSIVVFVLNYIPLLLFNIRHDNILWTSLQDFVNIGTGITTASLGLFEKFEFLIFQVALPFLINYLFHSTNLLFTSFFAIMLGFACYLVIKSKVKYLLFLLLQPAIILLGLVFYQGHIADYYFQQIVFSSIVLSAIALKNSRILFLIFVIVFLSVNISKAVNSKSPINYEHKKRVVEYIIKDTDKLSFNVYYDMPLGINTGYEYLFKWKKRGPEDYAKNLYIIEFSETKKTDLVNYYNTYPGKKIKVKYIGKGLYIISVK